MLTKKKSVLAKKGLWRPEYVFTAYKLTRSGKSKTDVARYLGTSGANLTYWMKTKPEFKAAVKAGVAEYKNITSGKPTKFEDYVYGRLSPQVRDLYKEIKKIDTAKRTKGAKRDLIEDLLENKGEHCRQQIFIHSLIQSGFRIHTALRRANMSYQMFKHWSEKDTNFQALLEEMQWHRGNFFEDALSDLVTLKDTQIVKHVNETFNSDRGYGKRIAVDVKQETVNTTHVTIEEIGLSLEEQKAILHKARKSVIATVIPEEEKVSTSPQPTLPIPKSRKKRRK